MSKFFAVCLPAGPKVYNMQSTKGGGEERAQIKADYTFFIVLAEMYKNAPPNIVENFLKSYNYWSKVKVYASCLDLKHILCSQIFQRIENT